MADRRQAGGPSMTARTARIAELRPALLGGRALPAVRAMRVRVGDDGALVLTQPDGSQRVLAGSGEVRRTVLVDYAERRLVPGGGYTGPVLLLLGADGGLLVAFILLDWQPPSASDERDALEVSGFRALAAALGLPLEPPEKDDVPADRVVRRALLRPLPPRPWPGRWATPLGVLGLVLCWLAMVGSEEAIGAVFVVATLAVVGPVLVSSSRARAQARRAAATGATAGQWTGTVLRPRPDQPVTRGLAEVALQIDPDDLVLTDRGREVWLPGPRRGGVTHAVIDQTVVRLTDAVGRSYAHLDTQLWAPTRDVQVQLEAELSAAGLTVTLTPLPGIGRYPTVGHLASAPMPPRQFLSDAERGDPTLSMTWLSGMAAALTLVGALLSIVWDPLVGGALSIVTAVLVAVRVVDLVRSVAEDRRAARRVRPVPVEVAA